MYDDREFFIDSDIYRLGIGSTSDGLKRDADRPITLFIQKDRPNGELESNTIFKPASPLEDAVQAAERSFGPERRSSDSGEVWPGRS